MERYSLNHIAICFQGHGYCSAPSRDQYIDIREVYARLMKRYDVSFICHSIMDMMLLKRDFPNARAFYSAYAEDYEEIYSHFDLVVGTRVHGAGMASSLCIPSITINHTPRCEAVTPLGSELVETWEVINRVREIDIEVTNTSLRDMKDAWRQCYLDKMGRLSLNRYHGEPLVETSE